MFSAHIKINRIDYENTLKSIFPIIKSKIGEMESINIISRLFIELDDAALPILLGILSHMPEEDKNELLVHCLNSYETEILEKLNKELEKGEWNRVLALGSLSVTIEQGLYIHIGLLKIDYKNLLNNGDVVKKLEDYFGKFAGVVKFGGRLAASFSPDTFENKILSILQKDKNKRKLTATVENEMERHGIFANLNDIQFVHETDGFVTELRDEPHFILTAQMETAIVEALAKYLKSYVENDAVVYERC